MGFALGVCGELEEHLLQTCAVGSAELDEGHPGSVGELADDSLVPGADAELGTISYEAWAKESS